MRGIDRTSGPCPHFQEQIFIRSDALSDDFESIVRQSNLGHYLRGDTHPRSRPMTAYQTDFDIVTPLEEERDAVLARLSG
jgi:hypothetical protein